jgi:hypothetical protein
MQWRHRASVFFFRGKSNTVLQALYGYAAENDLELTLAEGILLQYYVLTSGLSRCR